MVSCFSNVFSRSCRLFCVLALLLESLLHNHCSSWVRGISLSSCSKSLIWVASESRSSFADSFSIACNSSVISCINAAVCFALSFNWLCRLAEGLHVVLVVLMGFFFPLPAGLAFPFSGVFFGCPAVDVLVVCTFWVVQLLVTMVGHEVVAGVSVVVATTACKSLYLLL